MNSQESLDMSIEAGKIFTPTAPIDERSLFAGRTEQTRSILDAVYQKGQHVVLYGERGVGKTSLCNVLSAFLNPTTHIICPRVNCDALDTFQTIWRKVFDEISLVSEAKTSGFMPKATRTEFTATQLLGQDITPDSVRRTLLHLSQNTTPVIIIDEFDRVTPSVRTAFADMIKSLSDHAVPATVVVVGVAENVDQLIEQHHSIERALVQIQMPRMSNAEIQQIVTNGLARLRMTIIGDALKRIVALSQGLPHYTHLMALSASRAALDKMRDEIELSDVEAAMTRSLSAAQRSVLSAYNLATRSPRSDNLFGAVLLACSLAKLDELGTFAAQDVRDPMKTITGKDYEIPSFAQHLDEFSSSKRGDILRKSGTKRSFRYKFVNPLMQPFVIMQGLASGKITSAAITED